MLSITCVEDLVIYTWALLYFLKSICIAVLSWQRGMGKIIKSNSGWLCHSEIDELASNPLFFFFFFPFSENKYFLLHSSSVYQQLNLSGSGRCLWARTHKLSSGNSSSRFVTWITFTAGQIRNTWVVYWEKGAPKCTIHSLCRTVRSLKQKSTILQMNTKNSRRQFSNKL